MNVSECAPSHNVVVCFLLNGDFLSSFISNQQASTQVHLSTELPPPTQDEAMMMKCGECGLSQAASVQAKPNRIITLSISGGGDPRALKKQISFFPLTCGDTFCHACLASWARSSLHVHQLVPLRCCQRRVPFEWIEDVLEEPEMVYYRFLLNKVPTKSLSLEVDAIQGSGVQLTTTPHMKTTTTTMTACASCCLSSSVQIALQCGHSYCAACLDELCYADRDNGRPPSCCSMPISFSTLLQLLQTASAAKAAFTSMIVIDDDDEQIGPGDQGRPPPPTPSTAQPSQQRRQSKRLLLGKTKKETSTKTAVSEIDLVDSPEDILDQHDHVDEDDIVHVDDLDEVVELPRPPCSSCKKLVLTTEAPCGHMFCLKCIGNRCRQAVKNDKDGGIGLPLRCCDELMALEMVRPAISAQIFTHYKKVVAKSKDALKQLTKRKRGTGKQKAKAGKAQASVQTPPPPAKRLRLTGSVAAAVSTEVPASAADSVEMTTSECVSCMGEISAAATQFKGPCGHVYCADCLLVMAKKSLEDRTLVPIRCCGKELPAEYVGRVLPKRSLATYNRFVKEKDWRSSNLQSDREYAKLVKRIGGKQCPKCGIGVQKITGCNAMSCAHGHRFCWGCGGEKCKCFYAY